MDSVIYLLNNCTSTVCQNLCQIEIEKLTGEQVSKTQVQSVLSSSNLSIHAYFCICSVINMFFYLLSDYFFVSLNLVTVHTVRILIKFVVLLLLLINEGCFFSFSLPVEGTGI